MNTQKAGCYLRVSTGIQFEEGYSIDAQRNMLQAYCESKGIKKYEFYIDGGFTGSNIERPEMKRLIEDVKKSKISHVITHKLDRLSRSQKDTLFLIEDVFNSNGVDFISLNENLDTSTPIGRAMLGIMSAFAQLEREQIFERTRMGMKERVKSGLWMGGGRVPYGYDYDRNLGILVPNKDADNVRKMYELYLQGYSTDKIGNMFGKKHDRIVIQILKRKTNLGIISYNGEEYQGKHEAIIDVETYEKAMDEMAKRSVKNINTGHFLLTGRVYCEKCGAKMRYINWGKNRYKFMCYSQQTSKEYLRRDVNCDNPRPWADDIENAVIKDLLQFATEKITLSKSSSPALSVLDVFQEQYNNVSQQIKRLYSVYANDENDLLLETIEEKKKELSDIKVQMKKEEERSTITIQRKEALAKIEGLAESWEFMSLKEKQDIVKICIEKVEVLNGDVKIHYNNF